MSEKRRGQQRGRKKRLPGRENRSVDRGETGAIIAEEVGTAGWSVGHFLWAVSHVVSAGMRYAENIKC